MGILNTCPVACQSDIRQIPFYGRTFNSSKEATDEYVKYADMLYKMVDRGFSAAVYTQTTDVEVEVNGLMTYDRKVIKLDEKRAKEINTRICNSLKK